MDHSFSRSQCDESHRMLIFVFVDHYLRSDSVDVANHNETVGRQNVSVTAFSETEVD